jgi:hypothetical protein
MIVWIHKTNQSDYVYLMSQEGSKPTIIQENDTDIQVAMTPMAMQNWVAVGYWYTM